MNKKTGRLICYLIIFIVVVILFTILAGITKNSGDTDDLKEKVNEEISYLDTKLIAMLNETNGISLENYAVTIEESNSESASSENETFTQGKTQGDNSSSGSEDSQNSSNSDSQGSGEEESTQNIKYKMVSNEILLQDRTPNWENVKSEIEKLYSSWSTIVLDLYKANVNNQDILGFNIDLDNATQAIKNEDNKKALTSLAKLYSYIPKYVASVSNDAVTNSIYKTKSNVLNSYAKVGEDNFTEAQKNLQDAEQSFLPILNDISSNVENQSTINKAYILIKEMQNSATTKDKEIFYIKYKNLMQELNNVI